MKKKKYILLLFLLCIPCTVLAMPKSINILTETRIITEVAENSATANSYLNCAQDIFIPYQIVSILRAIIQIIKIVIPVVLIVFGMIDFAKVVIGKPEDQMKKSGKSFGSRIMAAVLIFLVVSIVEFVLPLINSGESVMNCFACVVKDADSCKYVDITYPVTPTPVPTPRPTPVPTPDVTPVPTVEPTPTTSVEEA